MRKRERERETVSQSCWSIFYVDFFLFFFLSALCVRVDRPLFSLLTDTSIKSYCGGNLRWQDAAAAAAASRGSSIRVSHALNEEVNMLNRLIKMRRSGCRVWRAHARLRTRSNDHKTARQRPFWFPQSAQLRLICYQRKPNAASGCGERRRCRKIYTIWWSCYRVSVSVKNWFIFIYFFCLCFMWFQLFSNVKWQWSRAIVAQDKIQ